MIGKLTFVGMAIFVLIFANVDVSHSLVKASLTDFDEVDAYIDRKSVV